MYRFDPQGLEEGKRLEHSSRRASQSGSQQSCEFSACIMNPLCGNSTGSNWPPSSLHDRETSIYTVLVLTRQRLVTMKYPKTTLIMCVIRSSLPDNVIDKHFSDPWNARVSHSISSCLCLIWRTTRSINKFVDLSKVSQRLPIVWERS